MCRSMGKSAVFLWIPSGERMEDFFTDGTILRIEVLTFGQQTNSTPENISSPQGSKMLNERSVRLPVLLAHSI